MEAPEILVDSAWLAAHLQHPAVRVVHVGWSAAGGTSAARTVYEQGHVVGAAFLDVDRDLAGEPFVDGPGRHPLPSPEGFAETMAAIGVGDGTTVVAYDDMGGSVAARLWWMLHVSGHPAALLDGGLRAWHADGGAVEGGPAAPRDRASFSPAPWPADRVADANAVAAAILAGSAPVLDARASDRYRGEQEPIDPVAGHVPGAASAPWDANLGADGHLLPPAALAARYRDLGVVGNDAIAYCGSGVTACLDLFAMVRAGFGMARLYTGSWSDWIRDPARPVANGPEPGRLG